MKQKFKATLIALFTAAAISGCSTTENNPSNQQEQDLNLYYEYTLPQNDINRAVGVTPFPKSDKIRVREGGKTYVQSRTISGMDSAAKCSKTVVAGKDVLNNCVKTIVFPRLSVETVSNDDGVWVVEGTFNHEMGREVSMKSPDGMIVHTERLSSDTPLWFESTQKQPFSLRSTDQRPVEIIGPTNNKIVLSLSPLSN